MLLWPDYDDEYLTTGYNNVYLSWRWWNGVKEIADDKLIKNINLLAAYWIISA